MNGTRRYSSTWSVSIEVEEDPGADKTMRHNYQEELMLRMQFLLADGTVQEMLRDRLGTLTDDRKVDRVIIMPLSVTHPDSSPG